MRKISLSSTVLGPLAGVLLLSAAGQAQATTRTICLEFQIRDERFDCPTPGTTGVKRACDPGADFVNPVGMHYELWDKDPDGGDEFIGSWRIGGPGGRCVTFEWEGASYQKGEIHPDVYAVLHFSASAVASVNGASVSAVEDDKTGLGGVTWRDFEDGSHVEWNCTDTCSIPGGVMVPTHSTTSDMSQRFQMIDSAQRVLEMYNGVMRPLDVVARYPGTGCPTGAAITRTEFCIPSTLGAEGDRVAHEMGHVVQMQMFNQDDLRDVLVGGSWDMGSTSFETESGATTEGWAAYVGAVAWFDPQTTGVAPMYGGQNIETAAPANATCGSNRTLPVQAAKAFWDLDDANNEAGTRAVADDDLDSKTSTSMALQWDEFGDGTGNRQDFESGDDGVNLRDYLFRVDDATGAETMLEHNCLQGQTDD
jgi:hypothetical protein